MSQPGIDLHRVQELEERLRRTKEEQRLRAEEARALEDELYRARSSNPGVSPLSFDPDYHMSSSSHSPRKDNERLRSNMAPRTAAAVLHLKAEHAQHLDHTRPMKRSKTTHVAGSSTTQTMMRSSSSASAGLPARSSPSRSSAPGLITPAHPSVARSSRASASSGMMDAFLGQNQFQQPVTASIHEDSFLFDRSQRQAGFLPGGGKEMDVAEFLQMRENDLETSPIVIPSSSLLSPHAMQFPNNTGIPSACGSMTSGPTIETAPMTRSNSALNDGSTLLGQFDMVRIHSQHSAGGHSRHDSFGNAQMMYHPRESKQHLADPNNFLAMGANMADAYAFSYPASAPVDSLLSQHNHAMEKSESQESNGSSSSGDLPPGVDFNSPFLAQHMSMERSISKDSTKSTASLKLRAKEALSRQNGNAAKSRHLQPKPAADAIKKEPVGQSDTKGKDGKAVIAKAKYERPKHPKVRCPQCNENPDGFRGEHELRRHTEAKHKRTVKKWICRDPALEGIPHSENATKSLADCKHCSARKLYGAYYNAAAHLRRTHFRVKQTRKGVSGSKNGAKGSNSASPVEEKRGGKGGGDWPPMSELKLWMMEVTVPMGQADGYAPEDIDTSGLMDGEDLDGEPFDGHYDMAFAGVGSGFPNDHLQAFDPSIHTGLGQGADLLSLDTSLYACSTLNGLNIPSGLDYVTSSDQHHHNMASSMMSLDSHGYTSPVSSTATLTQAGLFNEHHMLPGGRDDLADLSFDLTFAGGH